MTEAEEWRPVVGYEGLYEVSSLGRVRSLDRMVRGPKVLRIQKGRMLRTPTGNRGYPEISLHDDGRQVTVHVHSLVAAAFIGPRPTGLEVCHNNGDPIDCRASNLRYDTHTENVRDTVRHGNHFWLTKDHCTKGHRFDSHNGRQRICLTCRRESRRRYKEKIKAAKKEGHGSSGRPRRQQLSGDMGAEAS